jgi:hypothetical protein
MRTGVAILILMIFGVTASAQTEPTWQTGKLTYHPLEIENQLNHFSESEKYYSGDYICLKGIDAQHAPDCREAGKWIVTIPAHTDIILADGKKLEAPGSVWGRLVDAWLSRKGTATETTFQYKFGVKLPDGLRPVEIELPPSLPASDPRCAGQEALVVNAIVVRPAILPNDACKPVMVRGAITN